MTEILETMPHRGISQEELAERERVVLAAQSLLGYQGGDSYPMALEAVLGELGIKQFDKATVEKYKAQVIADFKAKEPHGTHLWATASISIYSRTAQIPTRVLGTAVALKEKLGDRVDFEIEYIKTDPFLIAYQLTAKGKREGEGLYVDVWDEKGFEEMLLGVSTTP
jgi:hypothetical protein